MSYFDYDNHETPAPKSLRAELLSESDSLVNGDRNSAYGPPHQDFQRTADILSASSLTFGKMRPRWPRSQRSLIAS